MNQRADTFEVTPALVASSLGVAALLGSVGAVTGQVICPFRLCTGHACPGCGLSRAFRHGLRGNFELSWSYHPFAVLFVAQAVIIALWLAFSHKRERVMGLLPWIFMANALALTSFWILRWSTGNLDLVLS